MLVNAKQRGASHCSWFSTDCLRWSAGALVQYQHSLTAEPKCAAVLCNQATTFSKLGQHAEAVQAAKAALNINNTYDKVQSILELL